MLYNYKTSGVCSRAILVELDGEKIVSVSFDGGCNGNTNGICKLVKGRNANEVISQLSGVRCGSNTTSCPDQLSRALRAALAKEKASK